jgi:AraC family transcriptional regulator, transcriptional activator of pobA
MAQAKNPIIKFDGLYGDNATIPDFVHCEMLESRSKTYNWEIKQHLHTHLYQVFLIEKGGGILNHNNEKITFHAPCIIAIPANHLHGFSFDAETDGRVITLSDSFADNLFKTSPKVVLELNRLWQIPISEAEKTQFDSLIRIIDRISRELYEDLEEKQMTLQAYLTILFVEVFRFAKQHETHFLKTDNRQLKYFQDFQKNIKKANSALKTVTEYAKELNITTVHLNRICQSVAQKSALQLAQAHILAEAQKYLTHTSYTITEISYLLDFNDVAYFSRFFKQHKGVSPKAFRENKI